MNFTQLNLRAPIQRAIAEFGYTTPSPIQQKAIPPVLEGKDLIGCAQTGTGKTAAFALPMLELLANGRRAKRGEIRALILTPTRELALQIGQNFTDYGKYTGLRHAVVFGGVGQMPQVAAIQKGLDVLIACPGRLNDLTNQGHVNLAKLEIFVLDEADRMLDMGFVHDVKRVVAKLPPKRQNLMFSATMPKEIEALANTFLTNPVMVKVNPVSSTVEKIEQSLYYVEKGNKLALLIHLIKTLKIGNALVFSRTKHGADKIVKQLEKGGITAAAIHGNKGQNARVTALENFKAGKTQVLVATDIAARGIDINELSHVFNFDLPEVPETYVHRIGRTARAGADGVAISFCASEEKEYLQGIEKLNRKRIPVVNEHPWAGKPSPVKAVVAPVRGRKPAALPKENQAQNQPKQEKGRAKRQADKAAGQPTLSPKKEEQTMQDKDNRGSNRAPNTAPNGGQARKQNNRGNRQPRDGANRSGGKGGAGQNNGNPNSAKSRGAAPAQPKFDPRFLTPQAAEQIPHTAPVAAAAQGEMLDVRRMNQARNNQTGASRGNHHNNNGNQRNQNQRQGGRQNQRTADARPPRSVVNANAAPQSGNANRGVAQPNANAPRTAQPNVRSANGQAQQPSRAARTEHTNPRAERNNMRNDRAERNTMRDERAERGNVRGNGNAPHGRGGKQNQSGLRTVRNGKAMPTNEKDPGLILITKRPPQQKFTSFDDYMAAHGGVTAPVEEYGDK